MGNWSYFTLLIGVITSFITTSGAHLVPVIGSFRGYSQDTPFPPPSKWRGWGAETRNDEKAACDEEKQLLRKQKLEDGSSWRITPGLVSSWLPPFPNHLGRWGMCLQDL